MPELEQALFSRLDGFAGLTSLVVSRIYPLVLPQNPTLPAVTYQRIDGIREDGIAGSHGLAHPRIQIDSWGSTYTSAKDVATQVRTALYRQTWTEDTVAVLDAFIEDDRDFYEDDVKIFRVSQDFLIWHREA